MFILDDALLAKSCPIISIDSSIVFAGYVWETIETGIFIVGSVGPKSFKTPMTSDPSNSAIAFFTGGVKCCSRTALDSADKLATACWNWLPSTIGILLFCSVGIWFACGFVCGFAAIMPLPCILPFAIFYLLFSYYIA